jgi:hypothetical protein
MNSAIVWRGKSPLDHAPIMAVATGLSGDSANSKTGGMVQLWILREDVHPVEALRTGDDYSICGNCPHRPKVKGKDALKKSSRTCYVNVMAPSGIYKVYAAGKLPEIAANFAAELIEGRPMRLGAYGDPGLIPIEVIRQLTKNSASTGYTHQWDWINPDYSEFLMASCETLLDVSLATSIGYRTFYAAAVPELRTAENRPMALCPASKEAGKRTTCANCLACGGNRVQPGEIRPRQSLIRIALH